MSEMVPDQILMIAQAGSYLYGLNTPDSDTDYVVIYAEPTQVTVDNTERLTTHCYLTCTLLTLDS